VSVDCCWSVVAWPAAVLRRFKHQASRFSPSRSLSSLASHFLSARFSSGCQLLQPVYIHFHFHPSSSAHVSRISVAVDSTITPLLLLPEVPHLPSECLSQQTTLPRNDARTALAQQALQTSRASTRHRFRRPRPPLPPPRPTPQHQTGHSCPPSCWHSSPAMRRSPPCSVSRSSAVGCNSW